MLVHIFFPNELFLILILNVRKIDLQFSSSLNGRLIIAA